MIVCWRFIMNRSWIELDFSALRNNIRLYQQYLPQGCKIMGVIKANAYGHGARTVALALEEMGIDFFAVATIDEAVEIRESGIKSDILILGFTDPLCFQTLLEYHLTQTITDSAYGHLIEDYCKKSGAVINVHVALDTGMHRIGYSTNQINEFVDLYLSKNVHVTGIFSHLCVADTDSEDDVEFSRHQINSFNCSISKLRRRGIDPGVVHLFSSYSAINYNNECLYDYARLGILMFGVRSSDSDYLHFDIRFTPVMSLKSHISSVREIEIGESVSYGRIFRAQRPTKVASLALGYADGIPRSLSGKMRAIVNGKYVRQIGRICMDHLMLDVTDVENVSVGDVATIVGRDGDNIIYAEELAKNAGTITNELLSRLGSRLEQSTDAVISASP
jgi:serine/alanine racemase